jgi:glyceraldehyde-3-phosphate dehydrogenase/erythrose-4-phosphate dehydrogenase
MFKVGVEGFVIIGRRLATPLQKKKNLKLLGISNFKKTKCGLEELFLVS